MFTEMTMQAGIQFLYTNIGRGHPYYLDGIIEALIRKGNIKLVRSESDVFSVSTGLSRCAWKTARWLYRTGSSSRIIGPVYERVRKGNDYNRDSLMLRLMRRDIAAKFAGSEPAVIVAHPSLVASLRGRENLVYQHGELATPTEAIVHGASTVMVPTDEAARPFYESGYGPDEVVVTGLCVEPALVKQAPVSFNRRRDRIEKSTYLTGAFYSSGAEPRAHIRKLAVAAVSMAIHGNRAVIFARKGGHFHGATVQTFNRLGIPYQIVDSGAPIPSEFSPALIVLSENRREEYSFTARLFPFFDFLVAPSHERSNWALGLGLPMFIIAPCVGPFAPRNREILLESAVAERLESDHDAAMLAARLRKASGRKKLLTWAENGWGKYSVDGFERIADYLVNRFSAK
jgi:hypothetical protein